jgi:hypothetical protein
MSCLNNFFSLIFNKIFLPGSILKPAILYRIIIFLFSLSLISHINAQMSAGERQEQFHYKIKKATAPIKVDGYLDDASWQDAQVINQFWMKFPTTDSIAKTKLLVKLTYNDKNLYISADIYDSLPLITQTLKRDAKLKENDGFGIVLDPFNKKLNGYYFSLTPANVQTDDVISPNAFGDLNFSWDNKWYSQVKRYADHYTLEIAFPLNMFRYNNTDKIWGINFIHSQRKKNEFHTWTHMPINFRGFDIGFLGALEWDAPLPQSKGNITLIPFTKGGISQNKENSTPAKLNLDAGLDAKIALSSALNMDVTVNPDFSQIEVDRQVTNLSRFNIFLPERRTFFLENNDLFSEYGNPGIRPFYSRSIGLDKDGQSLPILGGVRLSGNVAKQTRIGLMNIQTSGKGSIAPQNYTSVNVQQRVLKRSSIKGYFLNHENFATANKPVTNPLDKYGRNAGSEFAYKSSDGSVEGWASYNTSMKEGIKSENSYSTFGFGYLKPKFECFLNYDGVGKNYYTDMGYTQFLENRNDALDTVIRIGYQQYFCFLQYNIYPKKSRLINQVQINSENSVSYYRHRGLNERANNISAETRFKNTANLVIAYKNTQTNLLFPTAFTDYTPLPSGSYHYGNISLNYITDGRKKIMLDARVLTGSYFGGKYNQLAVGFIARKQPYFTFELRGEYNNLKFIQPYGSNRLFLIAPRIEVNFTNNLFWTTFLQYNTQSDNFNINSRFQWRYKPASDLFLVYTDNYFADPFFKNKNRALVFKLNKWLNL